MHLNNSKNNNAKKTEEITNSTTTNGQIPKENDHLIKLKSSQFRHLNEQLYTQTGSQSLKMFKNDPKAKIRQGNEQKIIGSPLIPEYRVSLLNLILHFKWRNTSGFLEFRCKGIKR